MKPFVRGDVEGFFAFGLDALLAFIFMNQLCTGVLGFSPARILRKEVTQGWTGVGCRYPHNRRFVVIMVIRSSIFAYYLSCVASTG